jgi:hypothetical protein
LKQLPHLILVVSHDGDVLVLVELADEPAT